MALALDGTTKTGSISGAATNTVASAAFTNSVANSIIIALISVNNSTLRTVSSISGGGLTWTKRTSSSGTQSTFDIIDLEIWWALAATALSAQVITATLSGTAVGATIGVFAVSGADTTTPFDVDASLPGILQNFTTPGNAPAKSVSTTNANTFLFSVLQDQAGITLGDYQSGFVVLAPASQGFSGSPNFKFSPQESEYEVFSASQSSLSVGFTGTHPNYILIVDAIQAASSGDVLLGQAML